LNGKKWCLEQETNAEGRDQEEEHLLDTTHDCEYTYSWDMWRTVTLTLRNARPKG
jgi:hypothetical protein